jgi:hypothetical protein
MRQVCVWSAKERWRGDEGVNIFSRDFYLVFVFLEQDGKRVRHNLGGLRLEVARDGCFCCVAYGNELG